LKDGIILAPDEKRGYANLSVQLLHFVQIVPTPALAKAEVTFHPAFGFKHGRRKSSRNPPSIKRGSWKESLKPKLVRISQRDRKKRLNDLWANSPQKVLNRMIFQSHECTWGISVLVMASFSTRLLSISANLRAIIAPESCPTK